MNRWAAAAILTFAVVYCAWLFTLGSQPVATVTITESNEAVCAEANGVHPGPCSRQVEINCPPHTRLGKYEAGEWGYSYYCVRTKGKR